MIDLIYNIETGSLKGKIGKTLFNAYAGSGGRAGSKVKGAVNPLLANNSLATRIGGARNAGTHLFGPIPQGVYILELHETKKNWIRLNPSVGTYTHGRSGFAIHGRGNVGSHGCLVPADFTVVLRLCKLIEENDKAKGEPIKLKVIAEGTDIGWQMHMA